MRAPPSTVIRYAETDEDVVAIHRFLLVVATPMARCPVDPVASLVEVIRVTKEEVAIMAIVDGRLVGTMGLISVPWWYGDGKARFMTERWHFVLPEFEHSDAARALLDEALTIARDAGLEFIHQGRIRPPKKGLTVMTPNTYRHESGMMRESGG